MPLSELEYCVIVTFKMTEWVGQWICVRFYLKLQHSFVETIEIIQKAAAMGNWWLAISSWQCACTCTPSCAVFFCKTSKCPDDSAHLQHRFGALWYWLFPKLQSPLKETRFQSIDEIQENTMGHLIEILTKFCRVFWTVEEMLGELCDVPRCLLWRGLRCHCPMYNVSCTFYLLQ